MKKNNTWFSVILALLMVWFMVVLTSWVFLLILWENKDTKQLEYFFKAEAWAMWSLELAMLKSKNNSYSYSEERIKSELLCNNSCWNKDTKISYKIVSTWTWIDRKAIKPYDFAIIPLFSYNDNNILIDAKNFKLTVSDNIVWNIVSFSWWISWLWSFYSNWTTQKDRWNYKRIISWDVDYEKIFVKDYLSSATHNYLILNNTSNLEENYSIESNDNITLDKTYIIASWENMWTKQNIQTTIDTSSYLNLLKYSLYAPE